MSVINILRILAQTVVTFVVLILLAILAFYVTVFVVSTGASLAGYDPSGDFVILSAALLVVAALLGGVPIGHSQAQQLSPDEDEPTGFH